MCALVSLLTDLTQLTKCTHKYKYVDMFGQWCVFKHTHPHQVFIGGGSGSLFGNVDETQIIHWYAKNVSMQTCYMYMDAGD